MADDALPLSENLPLSEKEKEILQFLHFYRGIADKSPHILREMDDYIDGLSHQEVAFLHRHRARLDHRDATSALDPHAAPQAPGDGE